MQNFLWQIMSEKSPMSPAITSTLRSRGRGSRAADMLRALQNPPRRPGAISQAHKEILMGKRSNITGFQRDLTKFITSSTLMKPVSSNWEE
jgi:hypothetical protein